MPDPPHQISITDDFTHTFGQGNQHIERATSYLHRHAAFEQRPLGWEKLKIAK
jgi:hypothetical protein